MIAPAARTPPRAMEPVSPIKIFAGFLLKIRNPRQPPATAPNITGSPMKQKAVPAITINSETRVVTPDARPSSPSVRFTAFTTPTTINITNGIYNHKGIVHSIDVNGIFIAVSSTPIT